MGGLKQRSKSFAMKNDKITPRTGASVVIQAPDNKGVAEYTIVKMQNNGMVQGSLRLRRNLMEAKIRAMRSPR
jgi:hypothetical protein